MMEGILKEYPQQIKLALKVKKKISKDFNKILVCGMGGSGIAGDVLSNLMDNVPVFVNKNYTIPKFIDAKTLAFVISYSGNTEETIAAYKEVKKKTKNVVVITSNGKLFKLHKDAVLVPQGLPPRTTLPFQLFAILKILNLKGNNCIKIIEKFDTKKALRLAKKLKGKTPVVYASDKYSSVVLRWKCQFNENSKTLSIANVFPEMNHNEIQAKFPKNFKVILLRDKEDHKRVKKRMDIFKTFVKDVEEVEIKGADYLSKIMYAVYFGDYLSYYLAIENKVDPFDIKIIEKLKKLLG